MKHANSLGFNNKFTQVIELQKHKGLEKIKGLQDDTLLSLAGYTGEQFDLNIGKKLSWKILIF